MGNLPTPGKIGLNESEKNRQEFVRNLAYDQFILIHAIKQLFLMFVIISGCTGGFILTDSSLLKTFRDDYCVTYDANHDIVLRKCELVQKTITISKYKISQQKREINFSCTV